MSTVGFKSLYLMTFLLELKSLSDEFQDRRFHWWWVINGLGNGSVPTRHWAITQSNDDCNLWYQQEGINSVEQSSKLVQTADEFKLWKLSLWWNLFQPRSVNTFSLGVAFSRHHWFREWPGTCMVLNHHLNQCCFIVNWAIKNKFQWKWKQNTKIYLKILSAKYQPLCSSLNALKSSMSFAFYSWCAIKAIRELICPSQVWTKWPRLCLGRRKGQGQKNGWDTDGTLDTHILARLWGKLVKIIFQILKYI